MSVLPKQLIYVSGPPCAGKSSLCKALVKEVIDLHYILGDDYWNLNNGYDFSERSKKTNEDILSSLKNMTSNLLLLEWVPSYGPFVENLKSICEVMGFEFTHIIIYAPREVLERRKLERDGNMDLGPLNLDKYKTLNDVMLFDSSKTRSDIIIKECVKILNTD